MNTPDLQQVLSKDRHFLQRAFRQPSRFGGADKINARYRRSHEAYLARAAAAPVPHYDGTLPVHEKRDAIKTAIAENQVVIVCGETGSGKTTQLPKICLELGRGRAGFIGHTQPRRLAARSVAERIAEELGSPIGRAVGFKVRFTDHTSPDSYVKLMTDGILLAETQTDRFLAAYDTIIIDEAHERSLNIDFLLGYLKQLLPKRPDLKVVITSATIDAERFSRHFADRSGRAAPVIEVSGRTYPVEIRYRPLTQTDEDEAEINLPDAIVDAADELAREGGGDILVFLPGEREIREAADALRKSPLRRNDDILPLFARLSHAEQQQIFRPSGSRRRIVLSTNVAETSLTVPGIRYVIDSGLARVKRYSARAKVEQLHVEKISQAAARQRAGRCGRVAAGVCIRLFDEEDFNTRPAFTDPEILRSNLAAVILRMTSLNLGSVADFPFLEAPEARYINDGYQLLLELGAVDERNTLTPLGKQMARLPVDPKISRMLLAAQQWDCLAEMLVIVSALSIQDPRERPLDARDAADKAHERFADKQSDFLTYLNIWDSFQHERDKGLSNRQLVQWCRQYFLSHLRIREWRELHGQLSQIAVEMGLAAPDKAFRQPEKTVKRQTVFDCKRLSGSHTVKPLAAQDIDALLALCRSQPDYYRHLGETPDRGTLLRSLSALPPGATAENKFFLGFWQGKQLVAALETVFAYPDRNSVLIGFLMVDQAYEGAGLGSDLVRRLCRQAQALGYGEVVLCYAEGNEQSRRFWLKNGFAETGETEEADRPGAARLITMTRRLPQLSENAAAADTAPDADLAARLKQKQINRKNTRAANRAAKEADYESIHRALLTGLIANIGMKSPEGHDYQGARGNRFHLFPGSALFKSKPKWIMAAELTETTRLYARDAAKIEPEWVETAAPHLVRYHYFEPHWSQKRGEVVASERVTLYGLTVVPRRSVAYGRVAPAEARELFIRGALVAQECDLQAAFFRHNRQLIRDIAELEHKSRKQDVLVDEETLFAFYDARLPENVAVRGKTLPLADIRTFETWRKTAEAENPQLLFLNREDLMQHAAAHVTEAQFPEYLQTADGRLRLSYRFEPHHPLDGVTVTLPLPVLNRLPAAQLEWLVPGMIREKLQLLIKALPKQIRRVCVPVPEFVTRFLQSAPDTAAPILPQLAHAIAKEAGDMRLLAQIDLNDWAAQRLPEHCYFNIRVTDDGGEELGMGRDLAALQHELGHAAAVTFRDSGHEFERSGLTAWSFGKLPESIQFARGRRQLTGYPALSRQKDGSISLLLFDTEAAAAQSHREGVVALMCLQLKEQVKDLAKGLPDFTQTALLLKHIAADTLREDIAAAVLDRALIGDDTPPRDEKAFKEQIKRARSRLPAVKEAVNRYVWQTAQAYADISRALGRHPLTAVLRRQLDGLVYAGFARNTPWQQWPRLPVYLQAMHKRLDKYGGNPARDQAREDEIEALTAQWQEAVSRLQRQNRPIPDHLAEFRWMIEELRVSLFAQELKTPYPVSVKRLGKIWDSIAASLQ